MRNKIVLISVGLSLVAAATANADWFEGDDFKMHFPQLPDPMGWDVNATFPNVIADDWECTESGRVTDFHIWGSWMDGIEAPISSIHLSIHSNIPQDANNLFSQPGDLLWQADFTPNQFTVIPYGTGDQGWYDPFNGDVREFDHDLFHQINIIEVRDPFIQQVGEIYWLDVSVTVDDPVTQWGWKTSRDHFMDDAVFGQLNAGAIPDWQELLDPITMESLDMAFVITPSPSAFSLVMLAGVVGLSSRRRR